MSALLVGCGRSNRIVAPLITATLSPVTQSLTVTPFPSQASVQVNTSELPQGNIIKKCVDISQADFPQLQGTLVLEHTIEFNLREILFRNLETQQEHFISEQGGEYYDNETVSPAGTYFSAETFTFSSNGKYQQGPILIFDSEHNSTATIDLKQESYGYKWLNEEQVIINNPILLISPFKNTQEKIQPFIPNYFAPTEIIYDWLFYGRLKNVYDPSMTRMLYPTIDSKGKANVTLRDVEKGLDLTSFPTSYGWGSSPAWSLDGGKLAIALNSVSFDDFKDNDHLQFEIFITDRNGEKLFTTNLASLSQTVYITNLSWSPNGRYIAFWFSSDKDHLHDHMQLAIFDTQNQTISRYCNNSGDDYIRFSPIWAPTNDYLLIAYRVPSERDISSLMLNIVDGKAWVVKSGFEPLGWLK
jgi:Periplasmic component of the Tol biopolymer transport system